MNVAKLGEFHASSTKAPASPQVYARIGGILYLLIIVAGILSGMFIETLTVSGDVVATANNTMASQ